MSKLSNEQRAHDLALLATQIEANNLRTAKYNDSNPFDIYAIYRSAYIGALEVCKRDFE